VTRALARTWFERSATAVAPELLGAQLVRRFPDGRLARVRIVETEAYERDDPASHSFRGVTSRTTAMFGPPGHLYVYLIYGMHHCLNVVTGREGHGAAVLLRAAEPLEGLAAMAEHRGVADERQLCRGPARLAQALGIDRTLDGADLLTSADLWLEPGAPVAAERIAVTQRIGISIGTDRPWRWLEEGSRWTTPTPAAIRPRVGSRPSR
jgi:DNA-3-methyladenine glycosylase